MKVLRTDTVIVPYISWSHSHARELYTYYSDAIQWPEG